MVKKKIQWSDQQEAVFDAVASGKHHLEVQARAGSGKTTTSVEALSRTSGKDGRVLAVAFNKTVASEFSERVEDVTHVDVSTLHSLGLGLAKEGLGGSKLTIDNRSDVVRAKTYAQDVAPDLNSDRVAYPAVAIYSKLVEVYPSLLGRDANSERLADAAHEVSERFGVEMEVREDAILEVAQRLAINVVEDTRNSGQISYSGMLAVPLALGVAPKRWNKVLVDEAQDMAPAQLLLAERCVKEKGQLVFVGDKFQGIYGWRGADVDVFERMHAAYGTKSVPLTVTRRCPTSHVELARRLVSDFEAAPNAKQGFIEEVPHVELARMLKPGAFVLSRTNAPLARVYLQLLRERKKAVVVGRGEIGKALKQMVTRTGAGKMPSLSITEVLRRIRRHVDQEVANAMAVEKPDRAALAIDRFDALEALSDDIETAGELFQRIDDVLNPSTSEEEDSIEAANSKVIRLSTIHRAKGLEADDVYLLAGTFYLGNRTRFGEVQEEKNCEYVALTRSRSRLTIVT